MIQPRVNYYTELIQILIYLADVKNQTRQNIGNAFYCGKIEDYFDKFKDHPAVSATRERVMNNRFNYIRPHEAAVRFEKILNGREELTEWAGLVKRFEEEAGFKNFFGGMSDYYEEILDKIRACSLNEWSDMIERYFKGSADFNLIICPLDGNYGFNIDGAAYVVRCQPYYNEKGEMPFSLSGFAKGIAHEYAHCFVNPIVEANAELLKNHRAFFEKHTNMANFYNVDYAVINEYWVRAFAIRFMEKLNFEDFDINEEYSRQRDMFIYIDRFTDLLKKYEKTDDCFEEFYLANLEKALLDY